MKYCVSDPFGIDTLHFSFPAAGERLVSTRMMICAVFALIGCTKEAATPVALAGELLPDSCIESGQLAVTTYGAIDAQLRWDAASMTCEGMRRPQQKGARLRFAGQTNDDSAQQLTFILSLPGLEEAATGTELPTGVTLIEDDAGRFFSTQENDLCWSNIDRQDPQLGDDGLAIRNRYIVSGLLFCVAPLAQLNGSASVTLSDMTFTGRLSWAAPK